MILNAIPFRDRNTRQTHVVLTARDRVSRRTGKSHTVCGKNIMDMQRRSPSATQLVPTTCDSCTRSISAMMDIFERLGA